MEKLEALIFVYNVNKGGNFLKISQNYNFIINLQTFQSRIIWVGISFI